MAVGVFMKLPGVKKAQYEQINERLFGHYPFDSSDIPDGLLMHCAGRGRGGWYVHDIWETKDQYRRFAETRLGPAVRATMGADAGEPRPDFYDIVNVVDGGLAEIVPSHRAGTTGALIGR
jgi:hypothetical protein